MSKENRQQSPAALAMRLAVAAIGMFAFGFVVLVPAYRVFCDITGLGGRTNEAPATAVATMPEMSRSIDLEFVTTVNQAAPWTFEAKATGMRVHPGGIYEAVFLAENLSGRPQIAQAVPSVAPAAATKYFKKLDCFCFTTQEFAPNEERELLVRFVVDRDLPEYVDTITLSYTLFDTNTMADASGTEASAHGPEHLN